MKSLPFFVSFQYFCVYIHLCLTWRHKSHLLHATTCYYLYREYIVNRVNICMHNKEFESFNIFVYTTCTRDVYITTVPHACNHVMECDAIRRCERSSFFKVSRARSYSSVCTCIHIIPFSIFDSFFSLHRWRKVFAYNMYKWYKYNIYTQKSISIWEWVDRYSSEL